MTKKVAIAQAFRLAFPDELGGMPYTQEEMEGVQPVQQEAQIIEDNVENLQGFTNKSEEEKGKEIAEKVKNDETIKPKVDENKITEAQQKKIFAVINKIKQLNKDKDEKHFKEQMKATYQVESTSDLTKWQASKFIEYLLQELEVEKNLQEVANEEEISF